MMRFKLEDILYFFFMGSLTKNMEDYETIAKKIYIEFFRLGLT